MEVCRPASGSSPARWPWTRWLRGWRTRTRSATGWAGARGTYVGINVVDGEFSAS